MIDAKRVTTFCTACYTLTITLFSLPEDVCSKSQVCNVWVPHTAHCCRCDPLEVPNTPKQDQMGTCDPQEPQDLRTGASAPPVAKVAA